MDTRDDELSLVDLLAIVARRRWLFLASGLAVVTLSATLAMVRAKVYEGQARIEIGRVAILKISKDQAPVSVSVEDYSRIKDRVEGGYGNSRGPATGGVVFKVLGNDWVIDWTARGTDIAQVRASLTQGVERLLADHRQIFESVRSGRDAYLKELTAQVDQVRGRLTELDQKGSMAATSQPAVAGLMIMQKASLEERLSKYQQELFLLRSVIASVGERPSRVVVEPKVSERPVSPDLKRYLILGVLAGTLVGGALAVGVELVSRKLGARARAA